MTYSIVGRDEASGELGVVVQSRAFGLGMCAWARPGVGAVTTPDEEVELARRAGLPEDQVAVTAAIAAGVHGDLDAAAAWLRPVAQSDPRWREAFERTVRLGHMPQALLDRLD